MKQPNLALGPAGRYVVDWRKRAVAAETNPTDAADRRLWQKPPLVENAGERPWSAQGRFRRKVKIDGAR